MAGQEEENPGHLSQQLQPTSPRDWEPLNHLHISCGALEYLPFFRTNGQLLEELVPQPGSCKDQGGGQTVREVPFLEDSGAPDGFFPYYRSKEEYFPRLELPGRLYGGSQDPPIKIEVQTDCFSSMIISDKCSAASGPELVSGSSHSPSCYPSQLVSARHSHHSLLDTPLFSDAASRGPALRASGFVPYYRTPEEGLHTSPGHPASPLGAPEAQRGAAQARESHTMWEWVPAESTIPAPTEQQGAKVTGDEAPGAQFVPGTSAGLGLPPSDLFPCHSAHSLKSWQESPSPWQSRPSSLALLRWTDKEPLHPASI